MPADLTTTYLGLTLDCPLVASSSPLTGKLESLRAIAEHGAGAVVLPSLFEEEVADEDETAVRRALARRRARRRGGRRTWPRSTAGTSTPISTSCARPSASSRSP